MSRKISRRKLLKTSGQAVIGAAAVGSAPGFAREPTKAVAMKGVDYYAKLGVTPFHRQDFGTVKIMLLGEQLELDVATA